MHRVPTALLLAATSLFSTNAAAVTQADADKIAARYLAQQPADGVSNDPARIVIADLDGDAKPEIVLWWMRMGPTFASSDLTVFANNGKGFVAAGSENLMGNIEDMTVAKGVISVVSKMPAPGDPRCCPSLVKNTRFVWRSGKLSQSK
ncbi:MAG TPA: hypothetical protein VET30_04745 [Pseudoxanthomonas sp.]|nr:hypothetical protein [Pseudoxanthomonas sp.]